MDGFETISCDHDGVPLAGFVARPAGAGAGPFPAVLVFPGAAGNERRVAMTIARLAAIGVIGVGAGMYDAAVAWSDEQAAGGAYVALLDAPDVLRARTVAWLAAVVALPGVDAGRLAALGYCFGGQCALELARSGAPLRAAIGYHALLTTHAPAAPGAIAGEVAVWCAGHDPYAPVEDIATFQAEMAAAGVRHQVTTFSDALHGFTDPDAAEHRQAAIAFDPVAEAVSWAGTEALLQSVLR